MLATVDTGYRPRTQFIDFHKRTQRFACLVCHRRAGKTVACVHDLLDGALRCEKVRPRFGYVSPYLAQSKAVAWDYLCEAVAPFRSMGAQVNHSELRVDLHNGSQVRLFGSDNFNALRGLYFDGIVLDEYADQDPRIGPVIGPTLADRGGWAVYIGTPKGHNAFYDIHRRSLGYDADGNFNERLRDDWYSLVLKASETKLLAQEELETQRRILTESEFAAEYECDFEAAVVGAYYGKYIAQAIEEGRVCGVPYDHSARVYTAWDLGYRDATAVWFVQKVGKELHLIDFYQSVAATIEDDVKAVLSKPYNFAGHILPHDSKATSKQTGRTTADVMSALGIAPQELAPHHRIEDGISNAQILLGRCWFDEKKTAQGLECLKLYRADYDEKLKTFRSTPRHDHTSHAADAFRYLSMAIDNVRGANFNKPIKYPKGWSGV